jgi:hypothetical protein
MSLLGAHSPSGICPMIPVENSLATDQGQQWHGLTARMSLNVRQLCTNLTRSAPTSSKAQSLTL